MLCTMKAIMTDCITFHTLNCLLKILLHAFQSIVLIMNMVVQSTLLLALILGTASDSCNNSSTDTVHSDTDTVHST